MTLAIEQLIKMHDPRCMSIESLSIGRGKGILSKEQMVGAFATAQGSHPIGYDLLMAKYRNDKLAAQRVMEAILGWATYAKYEHLEHSDLACQLALSMVLERNLPAQINHIAKLLRRYGPRAAQWRKRADAINDEIRGMEKKRSRSSVSDTDYHLAGIEITAATQRMIDERRAFREWSEKHAAQSNVCPRCSGTGKTQRPVITVCNECGGNGHIAPTFEHLRKSLAIIGAVIAAGEWPQYLDLVKCCMRWLYIEESQAISVLNERIRNEVD